MVIAPEHPFVERLTTPKQKAAVKAYREAAARKSDLDRTELAKEKTGVFTGSYAINPVNGEAMPIWVADYVLIGYGTGAIMAVPAHDERDFEFAEQFDLPITAVVDPGKAVSPQEREEVLAGKRCSADDGIAINSGKYDGLPTRSSNKRSPPISPSKASAASPSTTNSATGSFHANASGASRFRSCTSSTPAANPPATSAPSTQKTCRSTCPTSTISNRTAGPSRRSKKRRRTGSTPSSTASATSAKPTPCRNGPALAGTTCAFSTPPTRTPPSIPSSKKPGCRSIYTSAAPSTPCCICSTRDSGTKCFTTAASSACPSRSRSSSTRA